MATCLVISAAAGAQIKAQVIDPTATLAQNATRLLQQRPVREELGIKGSQEKSILKELDDYDKALGQAFKPGGNSGREDQQRKLAALRQKFKTMTATVLSLMTPAQQTRHKEIALQFYGTFALRYADVAKELGLNASQASSVQKLYAGYNKWRLDVYNQQVKELAAIPRPKDPKNKQQQKAWLDQYKAKLAAGNKATTAKARTKRKETEAAMLKVLTPAQTTKWNKMKGKPSTAIRSAGTAADRQR